MIHECTKCGRLGNALSNCTQCGALIPVTVEPQQKLVAEIAGRRAAYSMRRAALIAESHRRQFYGEDYQAVAIDIADQNEISYGSEDFTAFQSAPDENCQCGFCRTADWSQE